MNPKSTNHSRLSRPSLVSRPDQSLASRLTRTSILEPTTREVGVRPIRWSLLAIPVIVAGLVFGVREVARVEKVLSAEGKRAARVVVYQIDPGGELHVPIEPGTEVMRVIAHAVKKGALTTQPHEGRLLFTAKGEHGTRNDDVSFSAPGSTERVQPEDEGLVIGDPVAINLDVHGIGAGEMTISLANITDADGVVVRVYRRESVVGKKLDTRPEKLGLGGLARLAHHAGEPDWAELDAGEQEMLLEARWRRVPASPQSNKGLVARAVAVAQAKPNAQTLAPDPAIASVDLRADERAATFVHGKTTLRARADGDPDAKVIATVRHPDGRVDTLEGKGELVVPVPADYDVGVELARSTPGVLSIRADDPSKIEAPTTFAAWRTTKERPYVIKGGSEPTVLRVAARRPVARAAGESFTIAMDATISRDVLLASTANSVPAAGSQTVLLRATRPRSTFDRYEGAQPSASPTTSAVFHVLLPANGTLTLSPVEGPLDLTVSELDPAATPKPTRTWPAKGPYPPVEKVGDLEWGGYVVRKPTNLGAFHAAADGRVIVHVPHRYVPLTEPDPKSPTFRIKRPENAESIVHDGRTFESTSVAYEIDVPGGEPLVLPVRLFTQEKMEIVAKIDGEVPDRLSTGFAERVTTPRSMSVLDEARSVVVLGDDLPAGKHVLTFTPPPGKKAWIHLPWVPKPRIPGAPPRDPHWIEGDLED